MTVIGVAAEGFRGIDIGEVPVFWFPVAASEQVPHMVDRRLRWMQLLGRLKTNVSLGQAQVGLQPWFAGMLEADSRRPDFPQISPDRRQRYFASTLQLTAAAQGHSVLRRNISQPLWVLFAATGLLLALACLNVAGLLLARGSARGRELSTRLALGASRGRIGRQLLADSVLLALAGRLAGVAIAPVVMRTLVGFLHNNQASDNAMNASIDMRLLLFALFASLTTGLLSGFAPAIAAGSGALITALRERSGSTLGSVRLRKMIVTMQIAFTLVLVIGAALFARTLTGLLAKGPGFTLPAWFRSVLIQIAAGTPERQSASLSRESIRKLKHHPIQ